MSGTGDRESEVNLGVFGWLNRIMLWLIALAVIGLIVLKYLPLIRKNESMRLDVQHREAEVQRLESEMRRNQERINSLQSNPRAVEREAREQLGFARPDEQVVTFQPGIPPVVTPAPGSPAPSGASAAVGGAPTSVTNATSPAPTRR